MHDGLIAPIGTAGQSYLFDERAVTELRRQLALRRKRGQETLWQR
jgi:hypothetical protein